MLEVTGRLLPPTCILKCQLKLVVPALPTHSDRSVTQLAIQSGCRKSRSGLFHRWKEHLKRVPFYNIKFTSALSLTAVVLAAAEPGDGAVFLLSNGFQFWGHVSLGKVAERMLPALRRLLGFLSALMRRLRPAFPSCLTSGQWMPWKAHLNSMECISFL